MEQEQGSKYVEHEQGSNTYMEQEQGSKIHRAGTGEQNLYLYKDEEHSSKIHPVPEVLCTYIGEQNL